MSTEQFSVVTPQDFQSVIDRVLEQPVGNREVATLVTLTGDLGAGKTTFTQELARHLGVTEQVVSPTFGIMKGYELLDHDRFDRLIHIDAYRIEDISEVGPLRFEELFTQPRTLICLEWPERVAPILPTDKIQITIEIVDNEARLVTMSY